VARKIPEVSVKYENKKISHCENRVQNSMVIGRNSQSGPLTFLALVTSMKSEGYKLVSLAQTSPH
jgi:hypothetical protein